MKKYTRYTLLFAAVTAVLAGCATPPGPYAPYPEELVQNFFSRAQDPRRFWLSIYESSTGPVFTGGYRLHPNQAARLPFESRRSPWAPVFELQGRFDPKYTAMIDTTSKECWMAMDAALEIGLAPIGPPAYEQKPVHVVDEATSYLGVAGKLRLDKMHIENSLFYTRVTAQGLGPLARGIDRPEPEMVFGTDILSSFRYIQINYDKRYVTFSSTFPYEPHPDRLVAEAELEIVEGMYGARGRLEEEETFVVIDVAGDFGVAASGIDEGFVRHLSIGDLVLRHIPVENLGNTGLGFPQYPRIGRKMLARFTVTIDNNRRKIYFEKPRG
jgi:hypothetical protein